MATIDGLEPQTLPATAAPELIDPSPEAERTRSLFRVVWRWHFYAGLFTAPFLVTLSLTGLLFLFSREIEEFLRRDQVFVTPGGEQLPPSELMAAARQEWPGWDVTSLVIMPETDRSVWVSLRQEGREGEQMAFVNPYTGEVLGSMDHDADPVHGFFHLVLDLHRTLFLGTTGRIVIELVTCWGLLLLCTGMFLWWPRRREKVRGVWWPRFRSKPYVVLRDLHSISGIYLVPVLLVMVGTGLFYTFVWGTAAVGVSTVANQGWSGLSAMTQEDKGRDREPPAPPSAGQIDVACRIAAGEYPARSLQVAVAGSTPEAVKVSAFNDYARGTYGPFRSTQLVIDPQAEKVSSREHLGDHPAYGWHTWVYPLHVGSIGGPATKVVWLIACLVLCGLPVTGLWMWWKRRPAGQSGFPRRPEQQLPGWLIGLIVGVSLFLPLAGASILLALVLERFGGWLKGRRTVPAPG